MASSGASEVSEDYVAFVQSTCDQYEEDQKGLFPKAALHELFNALGRPQPAGVLKGVATLLDPEGTGNIYTEDFVQFWLSREMAAPPPLAKVKQAHRGPSTLLEATNARKESVKNAQMLANRVALLKLEEARTLKRIADANRQAEKIQRWKKVQEERRHAKQQHIREILRHNQKMKLEFSRRKEEGARRRMAKAQEVQQKKMEVVHAVRKDKLRAQKAYLKKIRTYKSRARDSHDCITSMKTNLKMRKIARNEKIRQQSEQAYVDRMKKELRTRSKKQKAIKKLEEQEANLIQRLQNAQLMQEDALSGLQYLLASRSTA